MIALLTGSVSKVAMYAMLATSLSGAAFYVVHLYNAHISDGITITAQNSRMVTMTADNARVVSALESRAVSAEAQAAKLSHIKVEIANAKPSSACINSAPVRAALDGLRNNVSH